MLPEEKNLKDTPQDSIKDTSNSSVSLMPYRTDYSAYYIRTNKLITALYMVTDMMRYDEPLRTKLRELGIKILSDIVSGSREHLKDFESGITEVLFLLDIGRDVGMISEMNAGILSKEFSSLRESIQKNFVQSNLWLKDFLTTAPSVEIDFKSPASPVSRMIDRVVPPIGGFSGKGHGTSIGVQKGSTLVNALKSVRMSDNLSSHLNNSNRGGHVLKEKADNFDALKNKRREEITSIIKSKNITGGVSVGLTITDIKNNAKDTLVSCSEKTLQRELVSMVSDRILYRTGSKRWSQYFLVSPQAAPETAVSKQQTPRENSPLL